MRVITLLRRNLWFHRRRHLAVGLGVATATATLTGALLVGDSMRSSLRGIALGRLGRVEHALVARRFVREPLARELPDASEYPAHLAPPCPTILVGGGMTAAASGARVDRVEVLGVDHRFWQLANRDGPPATPMPTGRTVVLNRPLAGELGVAAGDDVLLRLAKPTAISTETLLGRRDDTSVTLRLTVRAVIDADGLGAFSLKPRQFVPRNAWVPLATLQRALNRRGRINAMLIAPTRGSAFSGGADEGAIQKALQGCVTLADLGLHLRVDEARGYLSLESDAVLIEPAVEAGALAAAGAMGLGAFPILTYLANELAVVPGTAAASAADSRAVPYSTVTAFSPNSGVRRGLRFLDGSPVTDLAPGTMLLNEWTAGEMAAAPGDRINMSYYVTGPFGRLDTRKHSFVLGGIVRMDDAATDTGFAPTYRGITDTKNIADWDPPFPLDLNLVREKDEDYWDRYHAAPKAFVSLDEGRSLWAEGTERFGRATAIRVYPPPGTDMETAAAEFDRRLREKLDVARLGLRFEPVREQMARAATGSTDFGMLFVSFSFFLIASAAMLVVLLFRLGVERRAAEIGTLLATGFSSSTVTKILMAEGAVVSGLGAAVGLPAAAGYAWIMLAGLRSRWSEAVNAPFLQLSIPTATMVIGYLASVLIAIASIGWAIRGLSRQSVHSLLVGGVQLQTKKQGPRQTRRRFTVIGASLAAALAMIVLPMATDAIPQTVAFFVSGAASLVTCLALFSVWLHREQPPRVVRPGWRAWIHLGLGSAARNPGRSLLTAGLIASAAFIIVSLEAFRLHTNDDVKDRRSGTGGFALLAESAVPLSYDLNTTEGRDALGLAPTASEVLANTSIASFRLRPGDESSCLNLYVPNKPRILGATEATIERGGFRFSASQAKKPQEQENPWLLLRGSFPDGAIPVIGDEAAVKWQLHLGLGQDLVVRGDGGKEVPLRFVALLAGSVLQDELIIAESQFVELFPTISGHSFFLIDPPQGRTSTLVANTLERELASFALDVTSTRQRLAEYRAVQNTYLSTFQTLGGFGLMLGTVGLAVVMLRNVWERRSELALFRALGFTRVALGWMVLAENTGLVLVGLCAGALPAMVAIAPHVILRPASVPWFSLSLTLVGAFAVGAGAGAAALVPTLRTPLLPALRTE